MARSKIHVGLEIGTSKTCLVVAEIRADGSARVLGVGETRSTGVRKGEISDIGQVRSCLKAALLDAEETSDVDINSVFLSITGSHVSSVNNKGTYRMPEGLPAIRREQVEEVKDIAEDIKISSNQVFLHRLVRHFFVDGQLHRTTPIGLEGESLEVEFHLVHGTRSRIQNSIRCVREISLDVDDVVFAPIAASQAVLSREHKDSGALMIDIGGGTTDYVLFLDGSIAASGCVPVGGDHLTNDIHLVTHLSFSKAEKVKIEEAEVGASSIHSMSHVVVRDESGFAEVEVERRVLNEVARYRMEEVLQVVRKGLPEGALERVGTGVFLTGGASQLKGLGELTGEIFGLPIWKQNKVDVDGGEALLDEPKYSTLLGLIRYAQILDHERVEEKSTLKTFLRFLWPRR